MKMSCHVRCCGDGFPHTCKLRMCCVSCCAVSQQACLASTALNELSSFTALNMRWANYCSSSCWIKTRRGDGIHCRHAKPCSCQSRRTVSPVFSAGRGRLNPPLLFMYCRALRVCLAFTAPALAASSSTCLPCVVSKPKGMPMVAIICISSGVMSASKSTCRHLLHVSPCAAWASTQHAEAPSIAAVM